jgi:hypothetical protein
VEAARILPGAYGTLSDFCRSGRRGSKFAVQTFSIRLLGAHFPKKTAGTMINGLFYGVFTPLCDQLRRSNVILAGVPGRSYVIS